MSEQPGRYRRSTSGLIGAILITLLVIGAFVTLRALFRSELEVEPEPVDYLSAVGFAQREGFELVYPPELPEGWIATSVDLTQGEPPAWRIGMLTDDERFVGVRQEANDLDDMLDTYVDEDVDEVEPRRLDSEIATEWRAFEDEGGDLALAAELDEDTVVLVYGSAPEADVVALAELLTAEALEGQDATAP
ncbi:DUF4245 domain-containing protein [Nocardioides sp. GCM10027113]|uniref:DUF4245 domain-containing protein n=1 Tax=unclassified Nocardioides TaxID=2615069 RepID=UPI003610A12C